MEQEEFDFSKEYGIVLEGGGAKGAYQIGVWKALLDYGVKIKGVAGVSVGALNGALICMGDYERAEELWKNINYSSIMKVDDDEMFKLVNRRFKDINIQTVTKHSRKILIGGGFDASPLRQLLEKNVDEKKIRESDIEFIMGTFNLSNMKAMEVSAKESEEGTLTDYLMASSNFPLFKNAKLHGKTYLDGGLTNNVPIDMLINRGYKNIIVIRIYGIGVEKRIKIPEDVKLTYIAPKIHLCNVLEFDSKKAVRNINLGYYDAVRMLKALAGNEYYIESQKKEKDYLDALTSPEEEELKRILFADRPELSAGGSILRKCLDEIYPQLALQLKLGKDWKYRDLYYAVLEYSAKKVKIQKYKLYTEQEFCLQLLEQMTIRAQKADKFDNIMNLGYTILSKKFELDISKKLE